MVTELSQLQFALLVYLKYPSFCMCIVYLFDICFNCFDFELHYCIYSVFVPRGEGEKVACEKKTDHWMWFLMTSLKLTLGAWGCSAAVGLSWAIWAAECLSQPTIQALPLDNSVMWFMITNLLLWSLVAEENVLDYLLSVIPAIAEQFVFRVAQGMQMTS